MKETDLAWLAGLLEGEGSFYLKTKNGKHVPAIGLAMTDADIVERAGDLMGTRKAYTRPRRQPGWKDQTEIRITGKRAAELMRTLLPYMGERRRATIAEILGA